MTTLLSFLALATDVGMLFHARRQLQIAADAAATTGAKDLLYGSTTTQAITDAQNASAANGFTNGTAGTVVTVNTPPTAGYHKNSGYVEVIVSEPNPTYFMKFFGIGSMTVAARAVAGSPTPETTCGFLMDPSGIDLQLQGSNTINSSGCGWYVNSKSTNAVALTGNALTFKSPYVNIYGADPVSIGGTTVYPSAQAQSPPPIESTGWQTGDACGQTISTTSYSSTLDASTLNPQVVCFTGKNVDISGATLKNGDFVFENGVTAGNTGGNTNIISGTLDLEGGAFNQNSNSILSITAAQKNDATHCPSCKSVFGGIDYNGVALLVPATNSTYPNTPCATQQNGAVKNNVLQVQFGSNNQSFIGFIVAPNAMIFLQDNGGGTSYSGLYAACLYGKSSTITMNNYSTEFPYTTPLEVVSLVE